ncbi:MAG: hypothetical protein IPL26_18145 [Leptospiraceae bacterium]|nr:hypothetical protein [Leptospiraceae bacterium]
MKLFFTFLVLSFSFLPIFANSESAEKAEILCHCLKTAKSSNTSADKKACLDLREKQVKELGKNSPAYTSYLNLLSECEKEMISTKNADSLSYVDKVKSVCDCFKEPKQNRPKCFRLQAELGNSYSSDPEKKKAFNLETGSCDK